MNSPEIDKYGNKFWYNDEGRLHREDGPAKEFYNNKEWYFNGELHREDGPAIECYDSYKSWWFNGNRHRVDGPAVEYASGEKSWWYNGYLIGRSHNGFTQEDFERYLRSLKIKEYW